MVNSNSNWNLNNNEPKTKIEGNKVYWVFPNGKKVFARKIVTTSPQRNQTTKIKVLGPGTFFSNNKSRINNALLFFRNIQDPKIKNATSKMSENELRKFLRGKLGGAYTAKYLSLVGRNSYKNYVALTGNNKGILRGFAVISNDPTNTRRRNVKVIVGKGTGKLMMNKIVHNARSNGKNRLHLNSVRSAHNFYKRYGFVNNNANNKGNLKAMTLNLRRI